MRAREEKKAGLLEKHQSKVFTEADIPFKRIFPPLSA